ncbi:hypothetical protein KBW71_26240 [Hydrogenophaga aromaticivorans]|uniref:helix-turn-helix domain-containing protein n=1 Tax=Hydrogenophaga aromaticivorans TaxID=2610898 RepID=UPI001B3703FB|nr:helix-turn-helix domain-containing protein [Hydrogenophaga aromaticivorans]MBQ0921951.1 hypothetical protein [Hydrogenophaga aromaticivorans]
MLRYLMSGDLSVIGNQENFYAAPEEKSASGWTNTSLQEHLEQERKAHIARAATGGDKERAAEMVGLSRATLYRELKR